VHSGKRQGRGREAGEEKQGKQGRQAGTSVLGVVHFLMGIILMSEFMASLNPDSPELQSPSGVAHDNPAALGAKGQSDMWLNRLKLQY
jgi:hypothetical protein